MDYGVVQYVHFNVNVKGSVISVFVVYFRKPSWYILNIYRYKSM